MTVPDHLSQHEAAEELPMITSGARVVLAEAMDRDRTAEVATEVRQTLRNLDEQELLAEVETGEQGVDWERLGEAIENYDISNAFTEKLSTLRRRAQRKFPSLLRVRFQEDETDIEFAAGQYVTVRYEDVPRPYSIATSPNDDAIEICVRRVPGGKLSSELCDDVEEGDEVTLRGPNGDFTLQQPSRRDMVFLATGTGVAPFRSMIEYTFEEGRDERGGHERHVWLLLGTGWRDDLAYREKFRRLDDERDNFHFVPTLSREEYLTDWDGETAYVQRTLLKYVADDALSGADLPAGMRAMANESPNYDVDARIDPQNAEVYACGTNAMVDGLLDTVRKIGVPERYVESEGYG